MKVENAKLHPKRYKISFSIEITPVRVYNSLNGLNKRRRAWLQV